eukprot:FR743510.1.p1 GENE.FR743510.1~~FR743510.1.p1  ORF type:complete len:226 (+),score=15.18 FR743510.1:42-719(+)
MPKVHKNGKWSHEHSKNLTLIEISPETVYNYNMTTMCLGFLLSAAITFGGGYIEDYDQDAIITVFGRFNTCITFDYSPAKEIMTVLWVYLSAGEWLYVLLFWYRLKIFFPASSKIVRLGKYICIYVAFSCSYMILAMATNPNLSNNGRYEVGHRIVPHTVPFQVLIVGMMVWGIFTAVVGGHWAAQLPKNTSRMFQILWCLYLFLSGGKMYLQWDFNAEFPPGRF